MVQKWMVALDKGQQCFLRFEKKAFDLVHHDIPIYRLKLYTWYAITRKWFTSYLGKNPYVVKVGDTVSAKQSIKNRCPTGFNVRPYAIPGIY